MKFAIDIIANNFGRIKLLVYSVMFEREMNGD